MTTEMGRVDESLGAGGDLYVAFDDVLSQPGPTEIVIEILYCGVCHSDLHMIRNEWGNANYPMVPGHEIVGRVARPEIRQKVQTG